MTPEYVCVRHRDAQSFLDRAAEWLVRNEAENNLILGIAAQLKNAPVTNAYLVTIETDGDVEGCAFRTPPYKLGVTRMPAGAAEALAEDLRDAFDDVPNVVGDEAAAAIIANRIADAVGGRAAMGMRQRIYELTRVVPPDPMPSGKMRLAQPNDFEVLEQWINAFAAETNHGPGDARSYAKGHIANKTVFVWDDDGPKTTALWAGLTPHGVRIGFVYTPPEARGRGYASAVVAGASQRALENGYRFCCLYTNLANATSNSIYQKIGYEPVCDVVDYHIVE